MDTYIASICCRIIVDNHVAELGKCWHFKMDEKTSLSAAYLQAPNCGLVWDSSSHRHMFPAKRASPNLTA